MIDTVPLMARLQDSLVRLLRGLSPDQWSAPTACAGWTVKDIVAHLLDGHQRRLSACRDGHSLPFSGGDLGAFLNQLNNTWVQAAQRLSPRVLIDLHEQAGPQVLDFWRTLDPHGPACFSVAWAGEAQSKVWFDCARDFTEHWHHQQQIREATGSPSLMTKEYYPVVLSILIRSVPVAYSNVIAKTGTAIGITAQGDAGGEWTLTRTDSKWVIEPGTSAPVQTYIKMPQRDVWLLFTKKLTPEAAEACARISGDQGLARPFFHSKAIMG